jgi:hypothetical protein
MRFKTKKLVLVFMIAVTSFALQIESDVHLLERVITYSYDEAK